MSGTGFVTFLGGAFWFVCLASSVVLGIVVGYIGREKGRSGWNWFWVGLFLSLIGLIAVCAVPSLDRRNETVPQKTASHTTKEGLWGIAVITVITIAVLGGAWWGISWGLLRDQARIPTNVVSVLSTTTPTATAIWHRVERWSGNGTKQTETFSVRGNEWRVSWETTREAFPGAGILQVYVYSAEGDLVSLAANRLGVGSDVSYVHGQPGRFYLDIISGNIDWEIVVEDLY